MLPFSAYIGYNVARRALLCTLVDPTLRGLILSGPIGTGKSGLLRSFGEFARRWVDPDRPFVQVPVGVTDDRLIGGVDLDMSMATGELRLRRGLIAGANGGMLFVDDLPLLDELAVATIVRALESEMLICEREGLSACELSRFVLLATVVPSERDLSLSVADRVAFLIGAERHDTPEHAARLLRSVERYNAAPEEFLGEHEGRERAMAGQVATARLLHGLIRPGELAMTELIEAAERFEVAGNRAEIFAIKAARAHAALRGSRTIEREDLEFAIATVLAPRANTVQEEDGEMGREGEGERERGGEGEEEGGQEGEGMREERGGGEGARGREGDGEMGEEGEREGGGGEGERGGEEEKEDERMFEGIDFTAPLARLAEFFPTKRSRESGAAGHLPQWRRGRHTRSLAVDPGGRRIAVGATLRAAAPHQKKRRGEEETRMVMRGEDIRVKKFTERAGTLFIFCVDASGSMAMNRMRETKGAVAKLLQEAYVNRDSVALIAFRGADAEVLLPPTSSVERAKRSLDVLPTGGGTPLASALVKAYAMVDQAKRRGTEQALVVIMTDGRANVPLSENAAGMIMEIRRQHVRGEIDNVAAAYRRAGVRAIVIDTRQTWGAVSEATRLADLLGARYYFLPQLDARGLAEVVRNEK